jgi:hypothetical protein
VRSDQRKSGLRVIKGCLPIRGCVTALTVAGETCLGMIRIVRIVKILFVTAQTGNGCPCELSADMTLLAIGLYVCSGEWEWSSGVIK